MALARKLVAAGAPDAPCEARGGDGRLRICGPSLHRLAKLTVSEERGYLRLRKWVDRSSGDALDGGPAGAGIPERPPEPLQDAPTPREIAG